MLCKAIFYFLYLAVYTEANQCPPKQIYTMEILYQWTVLDYKWPPYISPEELRRQGKYIPENNAIFSMEVYQGDVFVAVGRGRPGTKYRDATGVPATLNKVVTWQGQPLLNPYPSWEANQLGNCRSLQNIGVIKVDRSTGLLWAVDMGTLNKFPLCPPKLAIYHAKTGALIRRHVFHQSVVNNLHGFIVDIALAQVNGMTRYAFMADVVSFKLVVYDYLTDRSWYIQHETMEFESCGSRLVSGDSSFRIAGGIQTIAVSPDSKYIYYSSVSGYKFYQIPVAAIAAHPGKDCTKYIRDIGETPLQNMFMTGGVNKVYFSDFSRSSIKAWDRKTDLAECETEANVKIRTYETIMRNEDILVFVSALALEDGYLYFMSNNMAEQRFNTINFNNPCRPNFIVGRIFVNDISPLQESTYSLKSTTKY